MKLRYRGHHRATAIAIMLCGLVANAKGALSINQWTGNNGTTNYNDALNWLLGNVPNSSDQATIYSGNVIINSNPPTVGAILDDGQLHVNTHTLNVNGLVDVDLSSGELFANGTLNAGSYINHGLLSSGTGSSSLNISNTFTLSGSTGNIATIDANGQSMTLSATTFEMHDFNSEVDVSDSGGSLDLEGSLDLVSGNLGAEIDVGNSSQITFGGSSSEWIIGYYQKSGGGFAAHGSLNLSGGTSSGTAAKVNGFAIYDTSVNVTGDGNMQTGEFDGGCNVNVASGGYLIVGGPSFRGQSNSTQIFINGPGRVDFNAATLVGFSASCVPYTEVDVESNVNFSLGGTSGTNASCDIQNGELDIYSSTLDAGALFNAYQGQLTIEGGSKLNVAGNTWIMAGPVTMGPGATITGQTMYVLGGSLPAGEYAITPQTNGGNPAVISAPLELISATVYFPQSAFANSLRFDGTTDYDGVTVSSGPYVQGTQPYGTLIQNGSATVSASTTIFCNTLDMDGTSNTASWTINAGNTLSMQAWFLDAGNSTNNPFHSSITINGGTLDMETNAGAWTLAGGTINMNLSPSNSPYVTHDKLILGSGATNGTINVGGGTTAYITAPLQSATNSVSDGNLINVGVGSMLTVSSTFGSDANAVLTKTGAGTLVISGSQSHGAGATINVNQGEMDLNTNAGTTATATLGVNVTGELVAGSNQHLASVHILSGGVVSLASGANKVLRTSSFTIDGGANPTGTLDITNDGAIIDYTGSSILSTIGGYVANAYDKGAWDKPGIMTSSALTKKGTAVGYADNNQFHYSTFDNQSVGLNTILIKYTWYGDLNLDGKVNNSDLALMNTGSGWSHGDLNYDGVDNADDFALFDLGVALQDGSITANVPEPALVGIIFIPVICYRYHKSS